MNKPLKIAIFLSILISFGTLSAYAANPIITSFAVSPSSSISAGSKVSFTWSSQNSTGCDLGGGHFGGGKGTTGSAIDYPKITTVYTLTCTNPFTNGTPDSRSLTVYVNGSSAPSNPSPTPTPYITYQPPAQTQIMNTACATSPASPKIGDAVTFASASSGGITPYTYTWSGDVTGSGQTVVISFTSTGTKTAKVTSVDFAGHSAQSSCSVNIISNNASPRPTPTYTPTPPPAGGPTINKPTPTPTKDVIGKVEGATTVCKQVTVCFDTTNGKTVIEPSPTATPVPTEIKTDSKSGSTSFLATIFNVKGDVWGKIKTLVIWYLVILLVIVRPYLHGHQAH
jgi:hypothetical protein